MLVVIALGGNALMRRGEEMTARTQRRNIRGAAETIAGIVRAGHRVVVTHGNGPQVGLLALQSEAYRPVSAFPLDVLGAETEGMIGYVLEQELDNALHEQAEIATLLTQVEVDPNDGAFLAPHKPVGPVYNRSEAEALSAARGWAIAPDGHGWRRVVASPRPRRILEIDVIRRLVAQNVIVICAGGGGIPVIRRPDRIMVGVEAVIDKDHASALLAAELDADVFLMLTDVPGVCAGWGTAQGYLIRAAAPREMMQMEFDPGTMAPKVEAACTFAMTGGGMAGIGALDDAPRILRRAAGTIIIDPKKSVRRAHRRRSRPASAQIAPPGFGSGFRL